MPKRKKEYGEYDLDEMAARVASVKEFLQQPFTDEAVVRKTIQELARDVYQGAISSHTADVKVARAGSDLEEGQYDVFVYIGFIRGKPATPINGLADYVVETTPVDLEEGE